MKKIISIVLTVIFILLVGGLSGILAQGFFVPWLASFPSLRDNALIKKANERTTIINKTEQVTVKENFSVLETVDKVLPATVSIITVEGKKQGQQNKKVGIKSGNQITGHIKTGMIVSADGLIVSVANKDNANKISKKAVEKNIVLTSDGQELEAELVLEDAYSDLALYKVAGTNLPVMPFADRQDLVMGEKMILVGNAEGEYRNTFSLGLIETFDQTFSLLNSQLASSEKMEGAIITDAQIDRRNIGGVAVDFSGKVMGVANQMKKDGELTNFIIPIDTVKNLVETYTKSGKLERPILGVYYLSINRALALLNNLPVNQGALIYSFSGQQGLAVIKNSSADKAGIKINDVMVEVNGEKIDLDHPLSLLIARHKKGEEISLKILRAGTEKNIKVVLN